MIVYDNSCNLKITTTCRLMHIYIYIYIIAKKKLYNNMIKIIQICTYDVYIYVIKFDEAIAGKFFQGDIGELQTA